MNKNIDDLKELTESEKDFNSVRLQDLVLYYIIPIFEDFEKRLTELRKRPTLQEVEKEFRMRGLKIGQEIIGKRG